MTLSLPIFHIGANKAGSTTLQRALFARHPQVLNVGKPCFAPGLWAAIDSIRRACNNRQLNPPTIEPEQFKRAWQHAIEPVEGRIPILSYEELIRPHFYGGPDPARLPKVIKAMAGPVRVVIVTRHQLRLIESLYIHKNNMADYLPAEKWLASQADWFAYGYRFHEIAEAWASVMGEENVGVFMFEEMVSDTASFARQLCDFIGIERNVGVKLLANQHENARKSQRTQTYARLRASLLPRTALGAFLPLPLRQLWRRYLESGAPSRVELPADWVRRMEEHYRPDNRKLAQRFHLPLQTYGYPM